MQPKIFIVTGIVLLALGLGTQAGVASQAPEDFFHQQEQTIRAKQAEEESKRRTAEEMVRLEKKKRF